MFTRKSLFVAVAMFLVASAGFAQSSGNFSYGTSPLNQIGCTLQKSGQITGGEQCQISCTLDASGNSVCTEASGTCIDHAVAGIKTSSGAGNIFVAWLLTLPAAAAIGALTYGVTRIFGTGALGPILVTLMALSLVVAAFARRAQRGAPVTAAGA